MAKINNKMMKVILKLYEQGFTAEKIVNLKLDEILLLPDVTLNDVSAINDLQKALKDNRLLDCLIVV